MSNINKDLDMSRKIAQLVDEQGGTTYYVGGYVRDKVLVEQNKDIDIEIHNISNQQLLQILQQLGNVQTQGASFGVYNIKGYDIDIAQPRMEQAIGEGHKDFDVIVDPYIGTEKAAKRRDFTINALMQNVLTGEIVDHYGGLDDIKNKTIRHVDDKTFQEDPLRVLRAAQFASRFDFTVASETKDLMQSMDLSALSSERIYGEMNKALVKSDKPSVFFDVLRETNQLDVWFPEVKNLINVQQPPKYHPEGDAYTHTMMTLDVAAKMRNDSLNPAYFMVSALCHDFGKPSTLSYDKNNVPHSYNHNKAGVPIAVEFLQRVNRDKSLGKYVENLVLMHDMPNGMYDNNSPAKKTNQMFDKCVCPKDLILLNRADNQGTGRTDIDRMQEQQQWLSERLDVYNNLMKEPCVTGQDLINVGMKPGKEFSEILDKAHKAHLSFVPKDTVLKGICTEYHIATEKPKMYVLTGLTDDEKKMFTQKDAKRICYDEIKAAMSKSKDVPESQLQTVIEKSVKKALDKGHDIIYDNVGIDKLDVQESLYQKYSDKTSGMIAVMSKYKQSPVPDGYDSFLFDVKQQIRESRLKSAEKLCENICGEPDKSMDNCGPNRF